jgi:hypothetical protein
VIWLLTTSDALVILGRNRPFKRAAKHRLFSRIVKALGSNRKKGVVRRESERGTIDNLEVFEVAAPAQREGASSNAAEWKRDAAQVGLVIGFENRPRLRAN